MSMRLLKKSEVDQAKTAQQKRDIEEGVKIARRIDNLREVAAQEEASLAKFRRETIAKINTEISTLQDTKEKLSGEILQLEDQRKKLMIPLDDEWDKVHKAKQDLSQRERDLIDKESYLLHREEEVSKISTKLSNLSIKTSLKDERATELLNEANNRVKEIETTLSNAKLIEEKALNLKKEFDKEIRERDSNIASKERSLEMREANIIKQEIELNKEWLMLKDRKKMVEKRIKKDK